MQLVDVADAVDSHWKVRQLSHGIAFKMRLQAGVMAIAQDHDDPGQDERHRLDLVTEGERHESGAGEEGRLEHRHLGVRVEPGDRGDLVDRVRREQCLPVRRQQHERKGAAEHDERGCGGREYDRAPRTGEYPRHAGCQHRGTTMSVRP